jgi:hypothetical protein
MTLSISRHWRLSILALAAIGTYTWAQESTAPTVRSQTKRIEATVEAIDSATREVTLKGPKGPVTVQVGPEARNFDQVHVGDTVVVTYYQGIAAQMSKNGVKATEPATSTFAYPNAGGTKPGGGVGASVTSTVTIQDVDPGTNTVAFKGSDGLVHIIAVQSPNMQKFIRTLKRGDLVDVTYTESVALDIEPSPSRSAGAKTTTPR